MKPDPPGRGKAWKVFPTRIIEIRNLLFSRVLREAMKAITSAEVRGLHGFFRRNSQFRAGILERREWDSRVQGAKDPRIQIRC
jgi:hypothetical protein